jgi:hypothetical protein
MPPICKVEIKESAQTLKALMREETNLEAKERLHSLYLLKSRKADSVTHAAQLICRDSSFSHLTVQNSTRLSVCG